MTIQDGFAFDAVDFTGIATSEGRGGLHSASLGGILTSTREAFPRMARSGTMQEVKQNTAVNVRLSMRNAISGLPMDNLASKLVVLAAKSNATKMDPITPTITGLGCGIYNLSMDASHTDTFGVMSLFATAPGAIPNDDLKLMVVAIDKTDSVRLGLSALPEASAGAINGMPLLGTDQMVASNIRKWDGLVPDELKAGFIKAAADAISAAANSSIAHSVLDAMLTSHNIPGTVGDGISVSQGLAQGNFVMDQISHDGNGRTISRVRLFRDGHATEAATDNGVNEGEFATFIATTSYSGKGKISIHKVVRQ